MRAFADVAQYHKFAGQTVKLGKDITLNEVNAATLANWQSGAASAPNWVPIGTKNNPFAGTFEGNGFQIIGLYAKDDSSRLGLFGATASGSTIQNVRLVDSYIEQTGTSLEKYTGGIVAESKGNIQQVYSNAIVKSSLSYVGGIAGVTNNTATMQVSECWFNGTVSTGTGAQYVGGIVGKHVDGTLNLTDVQFTGTIDADYNSSSSAYVGGLVGSTTNDWSMYLKINGAISAGTITGKHNHKMVGAVVGYFDNVSGGSANYLLENVFATRDCYVAAYNKHASLKVYESEKTASNNAGYILKGEVVQTKGQDRLLGIISQGTNGMEWILKEDGTVKGREYITDKEIAQLSSKWVMRTDDVPVLSCFQEFSANISNKSASDLAKEIGLNIFTNSAKITDAEAYGAGNYVYLYTDSSDRTDYYYNSYLTKLVNDLDFTLYVDNSDSTMDDDGVYSATYYKEADSKGGEWVLNITYVKNATSDKVENHAGQFSDLKKVSRIYISINTDINSLAKTLEKDNELVKEEGTKTTVSLSMLADETGLAAQGSNAFIFQLANGHFIINDGGYYQYNGKGGAATIINYLKSLTNGGPVYIDAWTISHFHDDHIGALADFANDPSLRENVYLDAIYVSEPSTYGLKSWNHYNAYEWTAKVYKGLLMLQKSETNTAQPDIYQLHMGQRYYFNGVTMDVIDTQEQHQVYYWSTYTYNSYLDLPDPGNTCSTNLLFTVDVAEGVSKKVLLGGDATLVNMKYMTEAYGTNPTTLSNVNVFAAYHHGKNVMFDLSYFGAGDTIGDKIGNNKKALNTWAEYLLQGGHKFDAVLFPDSQVFNVWYDEASGKWYSDGGANGTAQLGSAYPRNMNEANQYYIDHAYKYYTYGYEDCLSATKAEAHGTVKLTYSTETGRMEGTAVK